MTAPDGVDCCADPERYPRLLVAGLDPLAPLFGRGVAHVHLRRGHLADRAEARDFVVSRLRPLDLIAFSSKGRLSGNLIPGHFGHFGLYLGSEKELRALGIWDTDAVRPHQARVREGATLVESDYKGVHLATPEEIFNTDAVAVLRPRLYTTAQRRRIALALFGHLGTRFDYRFDLREDACLFCAELIHHVMPELRLPVREVYGRPMILPDEVVDAVRTGDNRRLSLVLYVKSAGNGWQRADARDLGTDLVAAWSRGKARGNSPAGLRQ
ncbi:YiiX/YebB-like N1pC/P60 family cysteine hydrolase [Polymorphum gilvum]|uniref:YiiX/YebB-like N1pC/P60 family cysteine hydrolase n=1 Tax=Polymorphum gilvum TaxID=991904 RepID=UPI0002FC9609|nr:YiiX/YebB-like N1pC/P60 family cysteine hydrolase [Polymorphum gilvum]